MFESWYDRHDEKTRFWLRFQVCSDGFGGQPTPAADGGTSSFPLFGNLPPELRLKIWECMIQPRIVIAACVDSRFQGQKAAQLAQRPKLPPTPALLHVCHESRALALKHYELAFAWKIPYRLAAGEAESGPRPGSGTGSGSGEEAQVQMREARVWFNFKLDALLLLGELEPFDRYGFNSPMVYFLKQEDTRRVRHVVCAFEELHLGVYESELIFGALFHIVDRFPNAGRLLVSSTPRDVEARRNLVLGLPTSENVIQKLWWAWINGTSVVTSSLASTQILIIREEDLPEFIERNS